MTARTRVLAIVGAAAVIVAGSTLAVTWLQTRGETTKATGAVATPRAGHPPLTLELGVRNDPEARALLEGERLLRKKGKEGRALAIFERYRSVDARIGALFARWPRGGGLDAMKQIVAEHPRSAAAQLHLAWAYLWAGRVGDAATQFRRVDTQFPDAPEAATAEDVLYSTMAPGPPTLVLDVGLPSAPSAAAQLALVERGARTGGARAKLRYGLALWTLHRRVSAERQFEAAAGLAPDDPVAQTAAAVGRFTKRNPVAAFARLGPLSGRFPHAAVVHLHLGTLLLWTGKVAKAKGQFEQAVADEPRSAYAQAAREFLSIIPNDGTK
ncbi:MAG TPA: tetratricopeptide repeat protein [Gaiellaceae bacterium]|nr:tetratricopeptide repeat protein [Gaiellaceae bacterium]